MRATPRPSLRASAKTKRAASKKSKSAKFSFASARFGNSILKTIEAQGLLTPEISEQIQHANTPKRLEDLYLPFKPKKQNLATVARQKGLEPLAIEIFEARPEAADMNARAATFISAEKELNSVEEVLTGVGHLIAERFSENAELRGRLRRIFQRSGRLVCTKVEPPPAAATPTEGSPQAAGGEAQSAPNSAAETAAAPPGDVGGEAVAAAPESALAAEAAEAQLGLVDRRARKCAACSIICVR